MPDKKESPISGSFGFADEDIGEDLRPAGRWVPVALAIALSKSQRETGSC
ncbi:MAG: hypothetical protein HY913_15175 [Desulfomonile tiedjei]|nr:hypothetical protein [Desulfomonile tiedjei]